MQQQQKIRKQWEEKSQSASLMTQTTLDDFGYKFLNKDTFKVSSSKTRVHYQHFDFFFKGANF